jgi:hypothetical protein
LFFDLWSENENQLDCVHTSNDIKLLLQIINKWKYTQWLMEFEEATGEAGLIAMNYQISTEMLILR